MIMDCTAGEFSVFVNGGPQPRKKSHSCCDRVSDFLLPAAAYLKFRNGRKSPQIER